MFAFFSVNEVGILYEPGGLIIGDFAKRSTSGSLLTVALTFEIGEIAFAQTQVGWGNFE